MIKKILLSILLTVVALQFLGYSWTLKNRKPDSFFCDFDTVYWYGYNSTIRKPEQVTSDVLSELDAVEMPKDKVEQIFNNLKFKYFADSLLVINVGPHDLIVFSDQNGNRTAIRISEIYGTFRIIGKSGYYKLNEKSLKIFEDELKRLKEVRKTLGENKNHEQTDDGLSTATAFQGGNR